MTNDAASDARNTAAPTSSSMPAEALHRRPHQELLAARRIEQRGVEIGAEHARRDRIHGHVVRRPLDGQRARQPGDAGLARHVGRDLEQADERRQRRDVDDAARSLRSTIVAAEHLAARSVPVRLVSMIRCQSASSISSVGTRLGRAGGVRPGCPRRPNVSRQPSRRRVRATRRRPTSAGIAQRAAAACLDLRRDLLDDATRGGPVATTSAPASARPSASARPMPLVPPTTTAVGRRDRKM